MSRTDGVSEICLIKIVVDLNDLEMKCFLAKISRNNIEDNGPPPRFVPETPMVKQESTSMLPSLG